MRRFVLAAIDRQHEKMDQRRLQWRLTFSSSSSSFFFFSSWCFDVALLLVPIFSGCSLKVGNERKDSERSSHVDCVIAVAVVGLVPTPLS